jgi:hypothetical protein
VELVIGFALDRALLLTFHLQEHVAMTHGMSPRQWKWNGAAYAAWTAPDIHQMTDIYRFPTLTLSLALSRQGREDLSAGFAPPP